MQASLIIMFAEEEIVLIEESDKYLKMYQESKLQPEIIKVAFIQYSKVNLSTASLI